MTDDDPYAARDRGDPGCRRAAARRLGGGARRGRRGTARAAIRVSSSTVARGSSDHAASFLKYAVELTAGMPVASVGPSIASIYGAKLKLDGSACLAISQSGKSPDIVAMAEAARAGGALTIAITNTAGSPLAEASDYAIDILAGAEKERRGDQDLRQFGGRRPGC